MRWWRPIWVLGLAASLCAACGSSAGGKQTAVSHPSTVPGAAESSVAAVASRWVTFVDHSRPTPASGGRARTPERVMRTLVVFPADRAHRPIGGRHPLVVFVHGIGAEPTDYLSHLESWALAGYVVAAPELPVAHGRGGTGADYRDHPEDVRFVVDSMAGLDTDSADPLHGHVSTDRVAVAGHSLGAQTVLGSAYNTCCGDPRYAAVVAISGRELPYGGDWTHPPKVPLLLVHGSDDPVVPPSGSQQAYDGLPVPRALLMFDQAGHTSLLKGEDGVLLDSVVVAFLQHVLRGDDSAWDGLATRLGPSTHARFYTAG